MSENERHDVRSIVNGRWAAYCTSGAALAITMMMVLVPAASGTTIIHPFKGWGPTIQLDVGKSGCTTSKATHAPTWAKKSGTFRFAGYSNSPNCPKAPVGGSSGQADGDFGLYGILHFASSGNYTVTANWSVTYSAMWNLTPYASCKLVYTASYSTCDSYAEVTVYSYLFMTDESNSTWGTYGYGYAIGGFVDDYNYTSAYNYSQYYCNPTCSLSGANGTYSNGPGLNGTFRGTVPVASTLNLSGTSAINKNDVYELEVNFYVFIDSGSYTQQAKGVGGSSASAVANVATGGNGAVLKGIVVT